MGELVASSDNPWISGTQAQAVEATTTDSAGRRAAPQPPTGPRAPQPAVPAPDAVDRLPRRPVTVRAAPWWVGVHGGAGETTLAQLLPGSRAADHGWPQLLKQSGDDEETPVQVVLVARSNLRGLTAAQRAATEWASGVVAGVEVLGLVIIADAPGRLPRPLKDLAALVVGGVPRAWQLPWSDPWRVGEVEEASAPKEVRRLLADVRQLVPVIDAAPRGTN